MQLVLLILYQYLQLLASVLCNIGSSCNHQGDQKLTLCNNRRMEFKLNGNMDNIRVQSVLIGKLTLSSCEFQILYTQHIKYIIVGNYLLDSQRLTGVQQLPSGQQTNTQKIHNIKALSKY
uniref:Uncharacterized protein n=1 Tax=Spironucleus salmonicida TaxID=348837 RepID=V6LSG1_9EUKA|eukprot:EST47540.1 Hypothetical protein SS50377_12523 [Spironucleus salmonicida]